ncbi:putative E3 ubiquitin-protein ligase HECTD4 [Takifugu flavidus]|uniref:Putative E3 ubiquitin-protein ligase HECTD4 n=1 Tax=Takifugu flavidus TaxID=433684 RepID=A0A5C6N232_9TELE|nr:putative E3 ubiquitin-protein ligase HECTD4 [Takifugu flavidus]
MNPQCARCGKIVYPTEKVSCLDTVSWMTRRSVLLVRFCEDDRNWNLWAGPVKLDTSVIEKLGEPLQRVFNLSLELGKVPTLWKTSCVIPVPKKNRPSELNDFRPTLERLFLNLLRPQVQHAEDSLQFAYRDKVGVEDAIIYLLHTESTRIWTRGDKLLQMRVDPCPVAWISSYLTDRPQFVRMKDITSDTVVSSIGAPQGTVLSPILFTLYTSDFCYNSDMCHIQKFADDTAIVGCIRDDEEEEYRCLVRDFVAWCHNNGLQLNTSKTKELVIDFGRDRPRPRPVQIGTEEVEGVQTYKYLGLWLDNRLDWTSNTRQLYKKTEQDSVVASVLSYAVVCWGGSVTKADLSRLEKLIRRASSVVGMKLKPLATVAERRTIDKLRSIMDNVRHPLHTVIHSQRSLISQRLRLPKFRTNRLGNSFIPRAIRLEGRDEGRGGERGRGEEGRGGEGGGGKRERRDEGREGRGGKGGEERRGNTRPSGVTEAYWPTTCCTASSTVVRESCLLVTKCQTVARDDFQKLLSTVPVVSPSLRYLMAVQNHLLSNTILIRSDEGDDSDSSLQGETLKELQSCILSLATKVLVGCDEVLETLQQAERLGAGTKATMLGHLLPVLLTTLMHPNLQTLTLADALMPQLVQLVLLHHQTALLLKTQSPLFTDEPQLMSGSLVQGAKPRSAEDKYVF